MRTPTIYELLKFGQLQKEKQENEKNTKAYFGMPPLRSESGVHKRKNA